MLFSLFSFDSPEMLEYLFMYNLYNSFIINTKKENYLIQQTVNTERQVQKNLVLDGF